MAGFRSKAEKRKVGQLVAAGKVKPETFAARAAETKARLPERIHPKKTPGFPRVKHVKVIK